MSRFRPPIRATGADFLIDVGDDQVELLLRLTDELRALLTDTGADDADRPVMKRLFPVTHPDDAELEAEYQRLMRDELVQSKLGAIDTVQTALAGDGRVDEGELVAFMQSINSVRLVLGSILGVDDYPESAEVPEELEESNEYHLYSYLSWLLDWTVQALSGALEQP